MKKVYLVTGGAGFIGSWVTRELIKKDPNAEVEIIDNLCSGTIGRVQGLLSTGRVRLHKIDLKAFGEIERIFLGVDQVFHFAANPDIAKAATDPTVDFYEGTLLTQNMVEAARRAGVKKIIYASGSGVYGERNKDNLTEEEGRMFPISPYGASKLGCEVMLSAYGYMYDMQITCFRFGNVVGGGQTHGVGYDFLRRLKEKALYLEILGNGNQTKPYIHVSDVVSAVVNLPKDQKSVIEVYNIAPDDQISVKEIANYVVQALDMDKQPPEFKFSGGDRGWKGDVPVVVLNSTKARKHGWTPKYTSHQAIKKSLSEMIQQIDAGRGLE